MNYEGHLMETLILERNGAIATITLNRPDKLNAINAQLLAELGNVIEDVANDALIRVVIITGAGSKAFAAGADIAELHSQNKDTGVSFAQRGQHVFNSIERLGKPVIAAVNGFALGGGCELAMACHVRFASTNARMGLPEITLGILPGYGGTQRLPRLIGTAKALEYILSCEMIPAATALELGLVNRVVDPDALMPACQEFASLLATRPIHSVRAVLHTVLDATSTPIESGLQSEATSFGNLCGKSDFKEGTLAFLEKRQPNFTGE